MVKGGSMGLGLKAIMGDLGVGTKIRTRTDASAAKGIATRKGLGKIRHTVSTKRPFKKDRTPLKSVI